MIFDAHADIWTDVTNKRQKGFVDIIKNHHLDRFNKGDIGGGIFVIWIDPPYDKDPFNRTLEMLKESSVEILENKDIIKIIREKSDIEKAISEEKLAIIIGLEGLSAIGKDVNLLYPLYMYGVRHASLTWNEENELATGVKGSSDRGLTKYGKEAVKKMEKLGMIVDVSHLNERSFWDLYDVATKPFIASHSNCKALCDVPRNLTNEQLKAIAESGGVVGVNAFKDFVHKEDDKKDIEYLANHIDYMVDIIGINHVGFGFDFFEYLEEESVSTFASGGGFGPKGFEDASKAQNIIEILKSRGYKEEDIEKIKYKNFFRIIRDIL
ncbi:dipeptidase [Caldisalinibacter kiritimatiensis]|uniref:Putative dipeptidase n=1 Tax=Caldisalinibacter kiritimatiensis TaxID=1304284 RepID=R1CYY6_9FIRM|nr:dipeptidase [Caldisalinibacter kiritimatiensis]EOD01794.1 putative dipeptidase [Caldisalinibacter kiritimatiensis]